MHPKFHKANKLNNTVIGAAMEVHTLKGPGLLEPLYQKFLGRELFLQKIHFEREVVVPIDYKGHIFEEPLRTDFIVEDSLIIETKCVEKIHPVHLAQLLTYMKLLDLPVGLLINFYPVKLKEGIRRLILKGADAP